jgi:hypothetical protein
MPVTVAFWNVRNLFPARSAATRGPRTPAELSAKLADLTAVIGSLATGGHVPDLLGIAEVADAALVSLLVAGLGPLGVGARVVFEAPRSADDTGIAVLALTPRIAGVRRVDADWGVQGRLANRPRALSVDATILVNGKAEILRFVACHWKSDMMSAYPPPQDREASGRWLERHVDRVDSVLTMGDMNAEPFAPEVVRGLRACRHYSTTSQGRIFNATWPWLSEPDHHAVATRRGYRVPRPRTTITTGPPRILDQIFVSRAVLQGRPFRLDQAALRFRIDNLTAEWMRTGNVIPRITTSDHFPIVAELTW